MTDWEIIHYGDEVQETIGAWPVGVRAYYARLTERMRVFGPNLGMPFTRSIIVLHAYIKKSQKAQRRELEVARRRLANVQRRKVEGDRHEDAR